MTKEIEIETKDSQEESETTVTEPSQLDVYMSILAEGFERFATASAMVGKHPEVERMWKGASVPTGLLWMVEEIVEAFDVLGNVAFAPEDSGPTRQEAQNEIADALNDQTGIIEALFGGFGSSRINEFRDQYLQAQADRKRTPMFWYGAVMRRVGSVAYGAVKAGEMADDVELGQRLAKPSVRATITRNLLIGKAKARDWDSVTIPRDRLTTTISVDVVSDMKVKGNVLKLTIGVANGTDYTPAEITEAILATDFDPSFVYGEGSKIVASAIRGKSIASLGAFKGALKKIVVPSAAAVYSVALSGKDSKGNVDMKTGRLVKLTAGHYKVEKQEMKSI